MEAHVQLGTRFQLGKLRADFFGQIEADSTENCKLFAAARALSLKEILQGLELKLPSELPDVEIPEIVLVVEKQDNLLKCGLQGCLKIKRGHSFLSLCGQSFTIKTIGFAFAFEGLDAPKNVSGRIYARGKCELGFDAHSFLFDRFDLSFSLQASGGSPRFLLAGAIRGNLFDSQRRLELSYKDESDSKSLEIATKDRLTLIEIDGFVSIESQGLRLALEKSKGTEAWSWRFDAQGQIELFKCGDPVHVSIPGTLSFSIRPGANADFKLVFKKYPTSQATISILLLKYSERVNGSDKVEDRELRARADLQQIDISRSDNNWRFASTTSATLSGVPALIGRVPVLKTDFVIENRAKKGWGCSLSLAPAPPLIVVIPDFLKAVEDASNVNLGISIGEGAVEVKEIQIEIGQKTVDCTLGFGLGLPSRLNELFGCDPKLILTYGDYYRIADDASAIPEQFKDLKGRRIDKNHQDYPDIHKLFQSGDKPVWVTPDKGTTECRLSFGSSGVSGSIGLPLWTDNISGLKEKEDSVTIDFDEMFKEVKKQEQRYGGIKLDKPKIGWDLKKGSLRASAGYAFIPPSGESGIVIPLQPFLEPVKRLVTAIEDQLGQQKGEAAAPFATALREGLQRFIALADLIDKELLHGGFRIGTYTKDQLLAGFRKLIDSFRTLGAPQEVLDVFNQVISGIERIEGDLPERFQDYLSIVVPEKLEFSVDITPDGSVSLSLRTGQEPLQLLLPMLPMLVGLRLRGFALGTALSNSVLKVELDAEIDSFDLPTLASSIALFEARKNPNSTALKMLPEPERFHRTFVAHELQTLIIYQTGIPIPIPLFYKRLEVSYAGVEGMELRLCAAAPPPTFNLKELLQRAMDLAKLFTKPGYLLTLENYGKRLDAPDRIDFLEFEDPSPEADIRFYLGPCYLRLNKLLGVARTPVYRLSETDAKGAGHPEWRRRRYLTEAGFKNEVLNKLEPPETRAEYQEQIGMGRLIGIPEMRKVFSLWDAVYLALNAGKKRSLNYLIQYFNIDDRTFSLNLNVNSLFDFDVQGILSTPGEFLCTRVVDREQLTRLEDTTVKALVDAKYMDKGGRVEAAFDSLTDASAMRLPDPLADRRQVIYEALKGAPAVYRHFLARSNKEGMPESTGDELLQLLVHSGAAEAAGQDAEGVAIFLRGALAIAGGAALFESAVGLLIGGLSGFATGVSFHAYILGLVDMRLLGAIEVSPKDKQEVVKLRGELGLTVLNRPILTGSFRFSERQVDLEGRLDLFPPDWPIVLKGQVLGRFDNDLLHYESDSLLQLGTLWASTDVCLHVDRGQQELRLKLSFLNSILKLAFLNRLSSASGGVLCFDAKLSALGLIDAESRLDVGYGTATGVRLTGSTRLKIGYGSYSIARVESRLDGSFDPADGFIGIRSELSPGSYILSSNCRISGSLAFYVWFGSSHSGDFVLSLGGYHPAFRRPEHYPALPRVGARWQITPELTVTGDSYFALTPSCIMTGGALRMTWQAGNLNAWFVANADFVTGWAPFFYEAHVKVQVGVSYTFKVDLLLCSITKTISASVGTDLHLWGPELSGEARVDIGIVSFAIGFGERRPKPAPLTWQELLKLSPDPQAPLLALGVEDGLIRDLMRSQDAGQPQVASGAHWIVDPQRLCLRLTLRVPVKQLVGKPGYGIAFGIAPMGVEAKDLDSILAIEIVKDRKSIDEAFVIEEIRSPLPKALWGATREIDPLSVDGLINDLVVGYRIRPKNPSKHLGEPIEVSSQRPHNRDSDEVNRCSWDSGYPGTLPHTPTETLIDAFRKLGRPA